MQADATALTAMLAAEDRRPSTREGAAPLLRGLDASAPAVRAAALQGLGRLENPAFVPDIAKHLDDEVPEVRLQAANALGQAMTSAEDVATAYGALHARVDVERDARVRGMLARTIGRLPYRTPAEVHAAESAMVGISWWDDPASSARAAARADAEAETLLGVAHGFASLTRKTARIVSPSAEAIGRLRQLARYGIGVDGTEATPSAAPKPVTAGNARADAGLAERRALLQQSTAKTAREQARLVRRMALTALASAKDADAALLTAAAADPDAQARRLALLAAMSAGGGAGPASVEASLIARAHDDASSIVRFEALRLHARLRAAARASSSSAIASPAPESAASCDVELRAIDDRDPHVALLAIDQMADCSGQPALADRLTAIVDERAKSAKAAPSATAWHRPAHAIVSLARVAPDRASTRLASFVHDPVWQARAYAARAAGLLKDRATLDALAQDAHDNVRAAALDVLQPLAGHDADRLYLTQLTRPDYQLVRAAARALAGSPLRDEATPALVEAFERITKERKDTSRDPRLALLETLQSLWQAASAQPAAAHPADAIVSRLESRVTDFDPLVAERVAAMLRAWTGRSLVERPRPLAAVQPPAWRELDALRSTSAVVHMAGGRRFTIALLPHEAPTNVMRFVRMVRAGAFNGRTFHRVEPDFVIQGGSPRANEYAGEARFTRDELTTRSNLRGTVGISTRGHDTGDGQIYVNLVDNYRLDHAYTIIGEIADGLDAVDAVLEGDVIQRIELR